MNDTAKQQVIPITEHRGGTMPIPQQSETAAMIHMIERMARDPSIDLARLESIIKLRLELEDRESALQFGNAMADAQAEMRPVATDASNPQTKSRYASYAALDRAIRPIYSKYGFGISYDTGSDAPEGYVRVLAAVTRGRHTKNHHVDMPADGKGAKGGDVMSKTHATRSAVTYGKRTLLEMIFNIAVGDDDGNAAGGETITEAQAKELEKLITDTGGDVAKFCEFAKVGELSEIGAARFEAAKDAIKRAAAARAKKAETK